MTDNTLRLIGFNFDFVLGKGSIFSIFSYYASEKIKMSLTDSEEETHEITIFHTALPRVLLVRFSRQVHKNLRFARTIILSPWKKISDRKLSNGAFRSCKVWETEKRVNCHFTTVKTCWHTKILSRFD